MRMIDQTVELDCARQPATFSQRLGGTLAPLTALFRSFRNRRAINGLNDLDDNQLRDIGLTRADVTAALLTSTFFEDPSAHLTNSARRRWRLAIFRSCVD
ncbi:DUF1127 domain-containing protein [Rhizobium sullae]|uniref:DUF1127 domain-containing protein n=1 Tax=Rhizobium sullae TaxID=50338 RepID=A0A2N0D4E1_RHISU|nr:DUF1127 domain-containing protein [Rhizobium sullae]PKA40975.1 DUF1127 domain-containing protein [Rhizobium sullae]TCU18970.1 uncharacterized protein DUF1127 [Rhizobium sullae]